MFCLNRFYFWLSWRSKHVLKRFYVWPIYSNIVTFGNFWWSDYTFNKVSSWNFYSNFILNFIIILIIYWSSNWTLDNIYCWRLSISIKNWKINHGRLWNTQYAKTWIIEIPNVVLVEDNDKYLQRHDANDGWCTNNYTKKMVIEIGRHWKFWKMSMWLMLF